MKVIEDYLQKDEMIWHALFSREQFNEDYENDINLKPLIDFLCTRVSFWYYKDIFNENPFAPLADFTISGGKRTVDITDLNETDCAQIDSCINHTSHPLLLGFLYDVLGIVRKNPENKLTASKYFVQHAIRSLNNKNHFGLLLYPFKRAFALLFYLKDQNDTKKLIDYIFTDPVFVQQFNEYPFKVHLLETISIHSQKSLIQILPYAERLYIKYKCNEEFLLFSIN